MKTTGYLWDKGLLGHFTSTIHPEKPERVEVLDPRKLRLDLPGLVSISNDETLGRPWALRIHSQNYLQRVQKEVKKGARWLDSFDTKISEDSYDVAIRSVAGAVSLTNAVCKGEIENGFAAIRPPGHHARPEMAKGFCIFNNIAICARFAQQMHGLERVLIVDWDVHPGDGTMSIFYEDPSVHFLSIHQDGIFTYEIGTTDQRGRGEGEGTTYNIPVVERTGEKAFLESFSHGLTNAASRCQPDIVLISCGFDAHRGDPVGNLNLNEKSFGHLTKMVKEIADHYSQGRIVSLLEGGYNPTILPNCVRVHLEELMD